MISQFQTNKKDIGLTRIEQGSVTELNAGEIRVEVEKFGFSANNITYALVGDQLGYWDFFQPINDQDASDWGMIPVWGFARVAESKTDEISVGERLFGYFPPASALTMNPTKVSKDSLFDGAKHRSHLPPTYNFYRRIGTSEGALEAEHMLLFPLFATGFCIQDCFADKDWHGAQQVLIISASSKTAIGTALAIKAANDTPQVAGLTSTRNKEFVCGLDCYDSVATYDSINALNTTLPTLVVDISGDVQVLNDVRAAFGENLVYCSLVGATHWDGAGAFGAEKPDNTETFFAPSWMQKRTQDWGAAEYEKRVGTFVNGALKGASTWLNLQPTDGLEGLSQAYTALQTGRSAPSEGIVIRL